MKHWIDHTWGIECATYEALGGQWGWFYKSGSYFALFEDSLIFMGFSANSKKTIQVSQSTIRLGVVSWQGSHNRYLIYDCDCRTEDQELKMHRDGISRHARFCSIAMYIGHIFATQIHFLTRCFYLFCQSCENLGNEKEEASECMRGIDCYLLWYVVTVDAVDKWDRESRVRNYNAVLGSFQ